MGACGFLLASTLNPAYFAGCVSSEYHPKFTYGAAEMATLARAASDSFELTTGTDHYRIDLDLEPAKVARRTTPASPAAFAASAHACGERKLTATASACIDWSSMSVQGVFALVRVHDGGADEVVVDQVPVHGQMAVHSLNLTAAEMDLTFDRGSLFLHSGDAKSFELASFNASLMGDGAQPVVVSFH